MTAQELIHGISSFLVQGGAAKGCADGRMRNPLAYQINYVYFMNASGCESVQ